MKQEASPRFAPTTITAEFPANPFHFHPFVTVNSMEAIQHWKDRQTPKFRRTGHLNGLAGGFTVSHRKTARKVLSIFSVVGLWMLLCATAWADQSVSLSWNTNAGPAAAGYALYR